MILLKAPYVLTMEGPILKDHAVLIEGERILQIAPQKDCITKDQKCIELPQMILAPGFINAHCHLELSEIPEPLPYPGSFALWIEALSKIKLKMSAEDIQKSIRIGINELLQSGTTTVLDHMSITTSPQPLLESALDGIIYFEVLGVEENRANFFLNETVKMRDQWSGVKNQKKHWKITITPHATYSLLPEFFSKTTNTQTHKHTNTLFSIHISESFEEWQLFQDGEGALAKFLKTKGKLPPTKGETPLAFLHRLNLLSEGTLAIHANYLEEEDIAILQEKKMAVVHCPTSHAYFEHDRFPWGLLQEAQISIALGTDSKASGSSLSMLEQMRRMLDIYSELTPEHVLKIATIDAAKVIHRESEIGSLKKGKLANIIGIQLGSQPLSPFEKLIEAESVDWMMIRGKEIF